ncbi:SDR family NAD(P)-dependent oxidoreductase [Quadrisphaera sp. INWT6]|uniref:SDR family NAD(P)-dependent oxidoreductase n=1 Tax=Quadrisphaera sp. INWT6 TaxID=2596917 RepID=UPI0018920A6C|nr:SDR family NAD(P)-dependent oxidoreductase [Quadrisphaera sp. INWT6]MBF5082359.1 SDR family NAD(P)-dependent oxidoreductase [Quadrisphaera sp. INWT6]
MSTPDTPTTIVLITGASRGMGARTAAELAATGATVFAGARRPEELTARLREAGTAGDIRPIALDVTKDASVAAAAAHIQGSVGALDVLINNAGVPGTWAPAADVGPDDFSQVLATNVLGPVRVTQVFLPLLRRGTHPRLVMVSSGMGSLTSQSTDAVYADIAHRPYPASKAAMNMLTVQYAKALPGIVVTAVDPGLTATEFTGGAGHSIAQGAEVIVSAALDTAGASGCFMDRHGITAW